MRAAIRLLHRFGIRKVRFTGGEPTLSADLPDLISFVKTMDAGTHTAITSNGVLLASKVESLVAAGLDSVNISIDTLDQAKFQILTGGHLESVLSGIDAAIEHVGNVKLNCVLMRGINDSEVERLIRFADTRGINIRFIEFMPNRYSAPGDTRFISSEEIQGRLPWTLTAIPGRSSSAARYYSCPQLRIKIGFIDSVSHPFCGSCDRIRLTANGLLYTCLFSPDGLNLFELLDGDSGAAEREVEKLLWAKRFGRRPVAAALPSFSAMGG